MTGQQQTSTSGSELQTGSTPARTSNDTYTTTSSSDSEPSSPVAARPARPARRGVGKSKQRPKARHDDMYRTCSMDHDAFRSNGMVSKKDGRLNISITRTLKKDGHLVKWLGKNMNDRTTSSRSVNSGRDSQNLDKLGKHVEQSAIAPSREPKPKLNIVIMVIGSRGDIQPFLKIGQILKARGHRVRIATHPVFRDFVQKEIGLEFFSIGGDPSELMAFMVKNPGLIPSFETVRHGEIARRRAQMAEMFQGFWRSCINSTDDEHNDANTAMMGEMDPFIADAIIANPPSFAHVHIAERLGVPLHMMFTFPYSPTQQFPHPLANIRPSEGHTDPTYANYMSYSLVELMTWRGLGDLVNDFRENTLGLEPISALWAPEALYRMHVSHTYMWSPALLPKPEDWGPEIHITGFVFLELASDFEPSKALLDFLEAGEQPIYIGFGSIVVDDPDAFTNMIFEAIKLSGVRALLSKGWGGIGGDNETPENVFMLEDTPHDWLFPRCSAVVHHGGAGTTAIGLKCGKPTVIVPFFGDQPFWGSMIAAKKAGAHKSIPYKRLTAERLAESIKQCLTEEARHNAGVIAKSIEEEGDGAENAVRSFESSLPDSDAKSMRCAIFKDRVAVWYLKHTGLRFSALAVELLIRSKRLEWDNLGLLRHHEYNDFDGPGEPLTGLGGAMVHSAHGIGRGFGGIPIRMHKHVRQRRRKSKSQSRNESRPQKATADPKQNGEQQPVSSPALDSDSEDATLHKDSQDDEESRPLAVELVGDAGSGIGHSLAAAFWTPLTLHLAFARGLHNAPRLYGDRTVRKPRRITSLKTGMRAARDEFCFGFYDGAKGLVSQPVHGVRDAHGASHKTLGLLAGLSKGVGGFILKPASAIIGSPALMGHGLRKEIQRRTNGPKSRGDALIRQARVRQGWEEILLIEKEDEKDGGHRMDKAREKLDDGWRIILESRSAEEKKKVSQDRTLRMHRRKHTHDTEDGLTRQSTAEMEL